MDPQQDPLKDKVQEFVDAAVPPEPEAVLSPREQLLRNLPSILFVVAGLALLLIYAGPAKVLIYAGVLFGLGFVIFIHELGHFAVAKWCDVYVETFSIGFGNAIPGCSFVRGETTYKIAWIPLGGYVKMLGEGAEDDEDEDNPRSYKNKPVWQRMLIISAGVIMNVIFGLLAFIAVYMMHGEKQGLGVVGMTENGSPAWVTGLQTGNVIWRIADLENPTFDDLRGQVTLSRPGPIDIVFGPPNGPRIDSTIEPRKSDDDMFPIIGFVPAQSLKLFSKERWERPGPFFAGSAASRATPAFAFGDEIIGTTDPDKNNEVTELPPNIHNPGSKERDFFAFRDRMVRLAGQEVTIRVLRDDKPLDIRVPPSYRNETGLRMKMGPIVAVREMKGETPHQVQYKNQIVNGEKVSGDTLQAVEVPEPGGLRTRWVVDRTPLTAHAWLALAGAAAMPQPLLGQAVAAQSTITPTIINPTTVTGVVERDLDPMRLPAELEAWAQRRAPNDKVRVIVGRTVNKKEDTPVALELNWDDRFRFAVEVPLNLSAPMAVGGLGIAYQVETTVVAVAPNSPARRAQYVEGGKPFVLQPGDVVKEAHFYETNKDGTPGKLAKNEIELKQHQWAFIGTRLQDAVEARKVNLKVERGPDVFDVVVEAEQDATWPMADRGLAMTMDFRLKKAETLGEAVAMGYARTTKFIKQVYQMLIGLATKRLSHKTIGGPIMIFAAGSEILDLGFWEFLLFLAMISVNLAVVNFLPIPVLDGGHFVFLLYEGICRRPAPEKVRIATTYVGLLLIMLLMGFVLYLDVRRYFF